MLLNEKMYQLMIISEFKSFHRNTHTHKHIKLIKIFLPISVVPPCCALTAILASASLNKRDAAAAPIGRM